MFSPVYLLLVYTVVYAQGSSNNNTLSPVPFKLYYESLCPGSMRFIVNELVPAYNDKNFDFAGLMTNLELVPYGHVYNPNFTEYKYTCQHDVPECEGNKLHGCAIKYIEDKRILLNYLSCIINVTVFTPFWSYPVNECKTLVPGDKIDKIFKCYNSNEGWDLFNQHGNATETFFGPNRFFVPYISFNNMKNDSLASRASRQFKKVLCSQNGVKHNACSDSEG